MGRLSGTSRRKRVQLGKSDDVDGIIQNRQHERYLVKPRPYVALNGSSFGGVLHDVSAGGLSVDVVGPKPTGNRVLVGFEISDTGEHFEAAGKIVWKSELSSRVGIQFIDLPESSHLKIQSWLFSRPASREKVRDAPSKNPADVVFVERSEWLGERSSGSTSVDPLGRQGSAQNPRRHAAAQAAAIAPPPPIPPPPVAPVAQGRDNDSYARELRNSFSTLPTFEASRVSEAASVAVSRDWKQVRQWLLTAAVLFLATVILAVGIRITTDKDFEIGEAYEGLKILASQNLAKLLSSSTPPDSGAPAPASINPPLIKQTRPHDEKPSATKLAIGTGTTADLANRDKFEILDAQHGRRYFPRTSTNLTVQFEKSGVLPPESSGNSNNLAVEPASSSVIYISRTNSGGYAAGTGATGGTIFGRVMPHSSGELPVTETIPDYPAFALQKNVQGRVVLTAIITKSGSLQDVRILSTPSVLDATVLEAVKTWRYQPHVENGKLVEAVTEVVVDFSITKN